MIWSLKDNESSESAVTIAPVGVPATINSPYHNKS